MLEPTIRDLAATGQNYGTVSVILPSGAIATQIVWVDADDEHVLFNTEVHRAKFRALERDPRVTMMIWKAGDPYGYAEVRGRVDGTITGPEARAHIDALSRRYTGHDYANEIVSERVIVKVRPERQRAQNL